MIAAAFSALIIPGLGCGLTAVMRDSTKPGQITDTAMPRERKWPRKPSPQARTANLLAQYACASGATTKAASDDMMAICPCPRAIMPGSAASTVSTTPSMLIARMRRTCSASSVLLLVPGEMPALAMTRSSGLARSTAAIHSRNAARSVTSSTAGDVVAPSRRTSVSVAASRPASRPDSARCTPCAA